MPIDDKLEDLEGEEKKKEPEKDSSANESPNNLVEIARRVMGDGLAGFFQGKLPGQNNTYEIDDYSLEIIKRIGLDLLEITPARGGIYRDRRVLAVNFDKDLNNEHVKEMVKIVCGKYALTTDLLKLAHSGNLENLMDLLPELTKLKEDLCLGQNNYKNMATLDPQIIVMGMDSKYRPLATIAVKKAMDDNKIILLENYLERELEKQPIVEILKHMTPPSSYYFEAAKEYEVQEIVPVIKDFKRMCAEYVKQWG